MPEPLTRLGPYELLARLGRGGMGEVWRARDTRLEREVAVKISAQQFTDRFTREARTVAALNHPNICALYDVGPDYLVMELIEGPTLAECIRQGAMPLDEAMPLALQIAAAVEAAHEKGIVHRDLKPDNIKVTAAGTIKVLDFGIAKALGDELGSGLDVAETLTTPATLVGTVLGTPAYMAPEQARGQAADRRSDIWAYGVVIYEMLTGERPFAGDTVSDILAAILRAEPDLSRIPISVRPIIARCLAKDRHQRWQAMGDVRLLLTEAGEAGLAPEMTPARGPGWLWLGLLATVSAAVAATGVWLAAPLAPNLPVVRFIIPMPAGETLVQSNGGLAIAPDGSAIAYTAESATQRELFLYHLSQGISTKVEGSSNAIAPFFSPDSRSLGFSSLGSLYTAPVAGGTPKLICHCRGHGTWGSDGFIYVDGANRQDGQIARISSGGGALQPVAGAVGRWPHVLPNGRGLLYVSSVGTGYFGDTATIMALAPLNASPRSLQLEGTAPRFLAPGWLVFARNGGLSVAAIDPKTLRMTGAAHEAVPGVEQDAGGMSAYAFSAQGTLTYAGGGESTESVQYIPTWLNERGVEQPMAVAPRWLMEPTLSPDGERIAFSASVGGAAREVWVLDTARGAFSRVSFSQNGDIPTHPNWTPDGKRVVYQVFGNAIQRLISRSADGLGTDQVLLSSSGVIGSWTFFPDGESLLVDLGRNPARLAKVALTGDHTPKDLISTAYNVVNPDISRDGRWLAYASDESGRLEVYVQSLTGLPSRTQISTSGGRQPRWSRDGRELFYANGSELMAVQVAVTKAGLAASAPRLLFSYPGLNDAEANSDIFERNYDVAPDGRFVALKRVDTPNFDHTLHVILNWAGTLRAR